MNKVILDASALLALLQEEKGSDQVMQHLPNAIMSSINVSEVIAVLINTGIPEKEAKTLITDIVKQIVPFDMEQAYLTAVLRKKTQSLGLSLGDRACLVLAQLHKGTALTADKIWSKLQLEHITVSVIR
jgi:ribonuclease VapC